MAGGIGALGKDVTTYRLTSRWYSVRATFLLGRRLSLIPRSNETDTLVPGALFSILLPPSFPRRLSPFPLPLLP